MKKTISLICCLLLIGCTTVSTDPASDSEPEYIYQKVSFANPSQKYLSEAEIGEELLAKWLQYYQNPDLDRQEQLQDWRINYVKSAPELTAESDSSDRFVVTTSFDVLPVTDRSDWFAGNGVIGDEGWIVRKFLFVTIAKNGDEYKIVSLGTGP